MDLGRMELGGAGVTVRIYYQQGFVPGPGQTSDDAPLVDGPRGWCLDMANTIGHTMKLTVNGVRGTPTTIMVGNGDPVTTGPQSGRSRTAADLAALGITTRGNAGTILLEN